MRWLLLLLLTLNVFYYLAHQQQAPFRVHQVAPVEGYTASSSALRLVTEAPPPLRESSSRGAGAWALSFFGRVRSGSGGAPS